MALTLTYTTTSSDIPQTQTESTASALKTFIRGINRTIKTAIISGISEGSSSSENSCSGLFDNSLYLTSIDVSNFDTSNITNMEQMFYGCWSITTLDVSNFNTSNVTTMESMFNGCRELTSLDLFNFDTSNVTTMSEMFNGCSKLTSLDISNFDTSKLTSTMYMFTNCQALTTIYCNNDLNNHSIYEDKDMFKGCTNLVGAIPYDDSKINIEYANPTTGYFTIKKIKLLDDKGLKEVFRLMKSGQTQKQADWNETNSDSASYIQNKPTIPPSIVTDDTLSMTSENPVQNKVITSKLSIVFGAPTEPSDQPINFSFSQPIPFNVPTGKQKLLQCVTYAGSTANYVEIIVEPDSSYPFEFDYLDFYLGKTSQSFDFINNALCLIAKNNASTTAHFKATYHKYSQTGTLEGSYSVSLTAGGKSSTETDFENGDFVRSASQAYTRISNLTKATPINCEFKSGRAFFTTYVSIEIPPVLPYTINGEPPKTPWEQLQDKVTALEGRIPPCDKTTDGTYILQATVTDGVVSYDWVSFT